MAVLCGTDTDSILHGSRNLRESIFFYSFFFQCMMSLQGSVLPEAAEILQILQRIELEGLFFTHDKLAERQVRRKKSSHTQVSPRPQQQRQPPRKVGNRGQLFYSKARESRHTTIDCMARLSG